MAATTQANVLLIAPELSTVDQAVWDLILADVTMDLSASTYGSQLERAARYLTAHYLTLQTQGGSGSASGPIIKEKVGDVMREYSSGNVTVKTSTSYSRTPYGQTFLEIRNKVLGSFYAVTP